MNLISINGILLDLDKVVLVSYSNEPGYYSQVFVRFVDGGHFTFDSSKQQFDGIVQAMQTRGDK